MLKYVSEIYYKALRFVRLYPLSLAGKCRIAFGGAVILVLWLALSVPYVWMGKLTKQASLDAGRAKSEGLLRQHFVIQDASERGLAVLDDLGNVGGGDDEQMQWVRFDKEGAKQVEVLGDEPREMIEELSERQDRDDNIFFKKKGGMVKGTYIRVFRAVDSCMSCHNPDGSAEAFSRNEAVGAVIIRRGGGEDEQDAFAE